MTEAVTAASAKAAALKYLTKDSAVVVYTMPGKKVVNDVPRSPCGYGRQREDHESVHAAVRNAQEWRKTPPQPGPPLKVHLPVPQTFSLDNGMKVYVVEDHALPVLSARVVSRAGSENNPKAKGGLATMVTEFMSEGTASRDLKKLADDEDLIGTSIMPSASMDGSTTG